MKINSLTLTNFKGEKNSFINFKGKSARIFGDNATGKSTHYDAFLWLLFDKDSSGAASFGIKTRNESGEEIPQIDHVVEGVIEHNNKTITLRKIYKEKWTKKRGQPTPTFTGHETVYEIDGVPTSKREYESFIDSIMPEPLFRLVTSPSYFNSLKWQDRRDMLIDTCGDVTQGDVLEAMETLGNKQDVADLTNMLNQNSLDDLKKIKNAERKKINDELSGIPSRIDEAIKAMPEVSGNISQLAENAQRVAKEKESLHEEKRSMENGGATVKLRQKIAELDTQIAEARTAHLKMVPDVSKEREKVKKLEKEREAIVFKDLEPLRQQEKELCVKAVNLGNSWREVSAKQFEPKGPCPTCGQSWPENMQEVAESEFNTWRSEELERIKGEGQRNGDDLVAVRTAISDAIDSNGESEELKTKLTASIDEIQGTITKKLDIPAFESTPEYEELSKQRQDLENEFQTAKQAGAASTSHITEKITQKQAELDSINKQISNIEAAEKQQKRVDELKARSKELAADFEKSERVLYLLDMFEQKRAEMLDALISDKFELVRWKLSDTQVNGGINPTCICTVNGVPYPDLNNGMKIAAGLDIIKTVSREKGFIAPIFIDNAESITVIPEMDCQVIELVVSEADKALRVELVE